jgi:hypothetical protein
MGNLSQAERDDSVRASDEIRELTRVSNAAFITQAAARNAAILANAHALAATSFGSAHDSTITFNQARRSLPSSPDAAELATTVAATSFGSAHGSLEAKEAEDPINFNLPTSYDVIGNDSDDDVYVIGNESDDDGSQFGGGSSVPLGFGLQEDTEKK